MQKIYLKKYPRTARGCRFAMIAAVAIIWVLIIGGAPETYAQTKLSKMRKPASPVIRRASIRKTKASSKTGRAASVLLSSPTAPVLVVNLAAPDYLSGEASVTVNPKQPTVIRLGLAQNAVSIVEFPASDGIYYIHEGNPKLASVFQSPTKETDRSITIYPGEGFLSSPERGSPSAAITLQMRSGLVLILELVPVAELRKNAHRCVVNYNRDDVIAARRSAGLAYDLGEETKAGPGRTTKATSKLMVPAASADEASDFAREAFQLPVRAASIEIAKNAGRKKAENKIFSTQKTEAEISALANKKLSECLRDPRKHFGQWSPSASGLALAVSRITEIDSEQRLAVVAVRNNTTTNLRLVPGSPELQIQMADAKGNGIGTERLERSYVESTSLEGMILPGSTVYYAFVYRAPILGVNQRVRVLVSHREAADAPAALPLSAVDHGKE